MGSQTQFGSTISAIFVITRTAEELSSPIEDARLQYAVWSPNANVPQIVRIILCYTLLDCVQCFVAGYTIFLHDIGSGVAMNITSYGLDRVAIYGIPDWVYEGKN